MNREQAHVYGGSRREAGDSPYTLGNLRAPACPSAQRGAVRIEPGEPASAAAAGAQGIAWPGGAGSSVSPGAERRVRPGQHAAEPGRNHEHLVHHTHLAWHIVGGYGGCWRMAIRSHTRMGTTQHRIAACLFRAKLHHNQELGAEPPPWRCAVGYYRRQAGLPHYRWRPTLGYDDYAVYSDRLASHSLGSGYARQGDCGWGRYIWDGEEHLRSPMAAGSVDGGRTWITLTLPGYSTRHPIFAGQVWGSGSQWYVFPPEGTADARTKVYWTSTNGGVSWSIVEHEQLPNGARTGLTRVSADGRAEAPARFYVDRVSAISRTWDGGINWTAIVTDFTTSDIVCDPVRPDTLWLATSGGNGIWRVLDQGQASVAMTRVYTEGFLEVVDLVAVDGYSGRIYVTRCGANGFVYSDDRDGEVWKTDFPKLYKAPQTVAVITALAAPQPPPLLADGVCNGACLSSYINAVLQVGKPINTLDGSYRYSQGLLSIPELGGSLQLNVAYNSLSSGVTSTLGYGWRHSYDLRVVTDVLGLALLTGDGARLRFVGSPEEGYRPYAGVRAEVSGMITTGLVLTTAQQTVYRFDPQGRVETMTLPPGRDFSFTYEGERLSQVAGPGGRWLRFGYNSAGELITVTDPLPGREIHFDYNPAGELITVTGPLPGASWTYTYTTLPLTTSTELTWTHVYTAHLLSHVKDPTKRIVERTEFTSAPLSAGGALGKAWRQWEGDSPTPLVTIDYGDGVDTRTITRTNGSVSVARYDARGTWVETVDQAGSTVRAYDLNFYPARTRDRLGNETTMKWDPRPSHGNLEQTVDALGHATTMAYDEYNNLTRTVDARGYATTYFYDGTLLTGTLDALGRTTFYTYTNGLLTAQRDAGGLVTQYGYDHLGQRSAVTAPGGLVSHYGYDPVGRLITTSVAPLAAPDEENVTVNAYDWADHLLCVTRSYTTAGGQNYGGEYNLVTRYGYGAAGRQVAVTDTLGHVTRNGYDGSGRLISTTLNYTTSLGYDPTQYNITTRYDYDLAGRQVTVTDTMGHVTRTDYDAFDRPVRVTRNYTGSGQYDPLYPDRNVSTATGYDANGNVVTQTGELRSGPNGPGRLTLTAYDALNRPLTVTANYVGGECYVHPDRDLCNVSVYDEVGNVTEQRDAAGHATYYEYDELGRLITTTAPLGRRTITHYNAAGQRLETIDPAGNVTRYGYDAGRLVTVTANYEDGVYDPAHPDRDVAAVTVYDEWGRRAATVQAAGVLSRTTVYTYSPTGRLIATAGPDGAASPAGAVTRYGYDTLGRTVLVTDALGHVAYNEYDALGRAVTVTANSLPGQPASAEANVTTVSRYNALGWRTGVRDARGNWTTFEHDELGRVITTTDPTGRAAVTRYDAGGRRVKSRVCSPSGACQVQARFEYDDLDRLVAQSDALFNTTRYGYDVLGNRVVMTNALGVATRYGYDALSRLITVTESYSTTRPPDHQTNLLTLYGYDVLGNRVAVTDALGHTAVYTYDGVSRLVAQSDALSNTTRYEYDGLGSRVAMTDANGKATHYYYDAAGRPLAVSYLADGVTVTYAYNPVGSRVAMTDATGVTRYAYDALYRVLTITSPLTGVVGYRYDAAGNRTHLVYPEGQIVTYTYDAAGRLESLVDWEGKLTTYGYDSAGQVLTATRANDVTTRYTYDVAGRLIVLQHASVTGSLAVYLYQLDALGNRVRAIELRDWVGRAYLPLVFKMAVGAPPQQPLGRGSLLWAYPPPVTATPEPYPPPYPPPGAFVLPPGGWPSWPDWLALLLLAALMGTIGLKSRSKARRQAWEVALVLLSIAAGLWVTEAMASGSYTGDARGSVEVSRNEAGQVSAPVPADGRADELFPPLPKRHYPPGDVVTGTASLADDEALASTGWWAEVRENIRQSEYHVTWQDRSELAGQGAAYQSPNRAHNLRTYFMAEGIQVMPRAWEDNVAPWSLAMRLAGFGYEGQIEPVGEGQLSVAANHVEYRHKSPIKNQKSQITEWYVNSERGLEQGFTLLAPPNSTLASAVTSAGEPNAARRNSQLVLNLALSTSLAPALAEDGGAIEFTTAGGVRVLRYGELRAHDAAGRVLPASLSLSPSPSPSPSLSLSLSLFRLSISVDAANAVYPITVDPLLTTPGWTAESDQAYAYMGWSVNTAGDVNGDGYSDVVVGAPYYDNGQSNEGRAFVYHGSASGLAAGPAWTGESDEQDAYYGASASTAGDVNGDGYADLAVGAYRYDGGASDRGRAYVYTGTANGLGASPAWTAVGKDGGDNFGYALGSAGDVDGDGYSDLVVGAPYYSEGQLFEGAVYVYTGSANGLGAAAAWQVESNQGMARLGQAAGSAGDVNGDGYSDVIAGAPLYDNGQSDEGRTFVYLGSASGLGATAAWTAESDQAGAYYGYAVDTAGDVNGDGYADVVVGACRYNAATPGIEEGRAYVYTGTASGLSAAAAWTAEGGAAYDGFGCAAGAAGDVNGDGYADLLVGAYNYDGGQVNEGRAYVYHGGPSGLAGVADWTAESDQASANLGYSVGAAGDVNGDGYTDVIVGAYKYSGGQWSEGRAYVYHGSPTGLSEAAWTAGSGQADAELGYSVGTAEDVNGDGYADVIVGAPYYDGGLYNEGKAHVYHGMAGGLDTTAGWTATGGQAGAYFGFSAASAGDVNGDGYADVIVGAELYDVAGPPFLENAGRAFVYHGGPAGLTAGAADWTASGDKAYADFGGAVGTAGDVNGDGYADVIVGAPTRDAEQAGSDMLGAAYAYYGSPAGLEPDPGWFVEGEGAGSVYLGISAGTAGDVNGDGYTDVIVGARGYAGQGKVYVYHGAGGGLDTTANWTALGEQVGANFGHSAGSAGDVNGDGYADVIVGANRYDVAGSPALTDAGKVYVYHGGPAGLLAGGPAWTMVGEQAEAYLGNSAGTAGDVNGDGYADVVVGAPLYSNGQVDEGRAYVYHGSASGLPVAAAWFGESDQAGAYLGLSVGTAGDVNGDGYADVIVGAPLYDDTYAQEGRGLVYYGNGGAGLALRPRQVRADGSAPIAPLGVSDSAEAVQLRLTGRMPLGREKVRLEWQVAPLGVPFTATAGVVGGVSAEWTDVLTGGVEITRAVTDLDPNTPYHWRARLIYRPGNRLGQAAGRWVHVPWNSWAEQDLRTPPLPPPPSLVADERAIDYVYDPLGRLVEANYTSTPLSAGNSGERYEYQYDEVGRRAAMTVATSVSGSLVTTYTYDDANRLQFSLSAGQLTTYTWDMNGNLLSDGDKTYTYDQANRLTKMDANPYFWYARYNGDGARVETADQLGVRGAVAIVPYTLDLAAPLPVVLVKGDPRWPGLDTPRYYMYAQGTRPLAEYNSNPDPVIGGEGEWTYYLPDGLGSVRQEVDENGQVIAARSFDPYGEVMEGNGGTPFGYTGEQYDADTQLVFLRARYLQPELGMFLSRDPWGGDPERPLTMNCYLYALAHPINHTDPTGLWPRRGEIPEGFQYSCRCGWIDWGHAGPGAAYSLIEKVLVEPPEDMPGHTVISVAMTEPGGEYRLEYVINEGRDNGPLQWSTALGVYKDLAERFEEWQAHWWFAETSFSEEDLPSNLIGFYMAFYETFGIFHNPDPSIGEVEKAFVRRVCEVVDRPMDSGENSRKVFDAYKDSWQQVTDWNSPRLNFDDGCGLCLGNRSWPAIFKTIPAAPGGRALGFFWDYEGAIDGPKARKLQKNVWLVGPKQ
ncbi:MAG: FG-GAP repeat protein [Thermoflexales bacterium]|nr:FG-GAP repeat protein [Thermoflexales bacterium]